MKIRGEIYNKRSYLDRTVQKTVNILFIKTDENIKVNGDMIKFIPIIIVGSSEYRIGEKIEVDGEISIDYIKTSMGNCSFEPVPVIRTRSLYKIGGLVSDEYVS